MKNKIKLIDVESNGIVFNVKIIDEGDRYGVNGILTHDTKKPLVEFYDSRFSHTKNGQVIARYYVHTLLNSKNEDLCLNGEFPEWQIDKKAMVGVKSWLNEFLINKQLELPEIKTSLKPKF